LSFKKNAEKKTERDKNFNLLLYWKREFIKTQKLMEDYKHGLYEGSETELKKRFLAIEKAYDEAGRKMYDIDEGVYMGIGYEMSGDKVSKPEPIIAKWSNLKNHVGFKGTTRVGKTVNMQSHIEQCIAKGMDVIVIDPKGGIDQDVLSSVSESAFRSKRSEDFMYVSPAFLTLSQRINVCYGLSNIELTGGIIESIRTANMDSFYLETAEEILMAITTSFEYLQELSDPTGEITRMLEKEEMKKYNAFLKNRTVEEFEYFREEDSIDMVEEYKLSQEESQIYLEFKDNGFNRTLITFKELRAYCHYSKLKALKVLIETLEPDGDVHYKKNVFGIRSDALSLLAGALGTEEKHFQKVSKTLSNRLSALSVGPIGELLCSIRINPIMNRLLRKDKGMIAVIQPFPMKYKSASVVLNKMLLGMLDAMFGAVGAEGRGLPRRVAIFIDEAGAIAYPGIENFFNRAGGLGCTVWVYTQTDEDYKVALGEANANVVIDNVNTKGIMKQNLLQSQISAAEEIGTFKRWKTIAMISSAGGSDGKYTSDVETDYICSPQDIKALSVGEGVLIHDGKTYSMEFPYRRAPRAAIKMPELDAEKEKRLIAGYEKMLEDREEKGVA